MQRPGPARLGSARSNTEQAQGAAPAPAPPRVRGAWGEGGAAGGRWGGSREGREVLGSLSFILGGFPAKWERGERPVLCALVRSRGRILLRWCRWKGAAGGPGGSVPPSCCPRVSQEAADAGQHPAAPAGSPNPARHRMGAAEEFYRAAGTHRAPATMPKGLGWDPRCQSSALEHRTWFWGGGCGGCKELRCPNPARKLQPVALHGTYRCGERGPRGLCSLCPVKRGVKTADGGAGARVLLRHAPPGCRRVLFRCLGAKQRAKQGVFGINAARSHCHQPVPTSQPELPP